MDTAFNEPDGPYGFEYDRIWANGVSLIDDDRKDISKWKGTNLLDFTLLQVRDTIDRLEEYRELSNWIECIASDY